MLEDAGYPHERIQAKANAIRIKASSLHTSPHTVAAMVIRLEKRL